MSNEAIASVLGHVKTSQYFFPAVAAALLVCVLLGFGPTFFLRPFMEVAAIPWYVHLHGLALTSWYALFLLQASLITTGRVNVHQKIGIAGLMVALAVIASSVVVVSEIVDRVAVAFGGDVEAASEVMWGSFARILGFTIFSSIAFSYRKNREIHRRSIVIASITIIQPAIGRIVFDLFSLSTMYGYIVMYSMIFSFLASLMLFDVLTKGRPHIISTMGLLFISIGVVIERAFGRSEIARQIVGLG